MIDQNRDGFIDKDDLHDMLASLGMDRFMDTIDIGLFVCVCRSVCVQFARHARLSRYG